jgi:hypothetical protein
LNAQKHGIVRFWRNTRFYVNKIFAVAISNNPNEQQLLHGVEKSIPETALKTAFRRLRRCVGPPPHTSAAISSGRVGRFLLRNALFFMFQLLRVE